MPYISVNHSLKIDLSAHSFSERFTENRILLLHFQWIHSLKIDSSAQSFSEPFTENSFYDQYFKMRPVCPSVCAFKPLPSDSRLRCCDRYIRCHWLLAVKPLSPREHAGRRVGKGGTSGSVHRASSDPCRIAAAVGAQWLSLPKIIGRCMYRPVELGRYPLFEIE